MPDVTILMPAYNEEATVATAIERVLAAELPVEGMELIVIENGSTDSTRAVLRDREWPSHVRILELDRNRGKGGALRYGLEQASGTYTAIIDADLEYDAADLASVLKPLIAGWIDPRLKCSFEGWKSSPRPSIVFMRSTASNHRARTANTRSTRFCPRTY